MKSFLYLSWIMMWFILMPVWSNEYGLAQLMGNLAEMDRLEQQAEELTAQADPEGASQAFGKAAMMADILMKDNPDPFTVAVFQSSSLFFRAQERGLRALALFERTGGQPPAPAGVCHLLVQSIQKLQDAKERLEETPGAPQENLQERKRNLLRKTHEWRNVFQGLQEDFACPKD